MFHSGAHYASYAPQYTHFGHTAFAPAAYPQFAVADNGAAAAADAQSQADEAAASQQVSISGFAGQQFVDPAAFYGAHAYGAHPAFAHPGATFIAGAHPQATFLAPTTLVPVAAPRVRQPGYNERLVAWRNRQKAFNRYKRQTKEAIRNSQANHFQAPVAAPTVFGAPMTHYGAAPVYGGQTFIGGAPYYGHTLLASPYPYLSQAQFQPAEQAQADGYQQEFSYQGSAAQQEVQQEEPEIRGTQV